MSPNHPDRHVPLEGAQNFRDLGGYVTTDGRELRWRMIYRADGLGTLADADYATLGDRGVSSVFDLRSAREIEAFGIAAVDRHAAAYHHVPFRQEIGLTAEQMQAMSDPERIRTAVRPEGYLEMIEEAKPSIGLVLRTLAEDEPYAAVFHCTGGKDRTGIMAALLLEVLGVPRETIGADYALTAKFFRLSEERRAEMEKFFGIKMPEQALSSEPATILGTLEGVDERYGSVARLLSEECGVTEEHQQALRQQLLVAVPVAR